MLYDPEHNDGKGFTDRSKAQALYDVSYAVNGKTYGGGKAVGTGDSRRRGFFSLMNRGFERDFAAGSTMFVMLEGQRIDQLSLAGTSAALVHLNRCLADVRQRLAAERQVRVVHQASG